MLGRVALAFCLGSTAVSALPGLASAATATPEEAARLTGLFETYVGHPAAGAAPGVVVKPDGDHYDVAFDLGRIAAPLHAFGVDVVAAAPYASTLTPQPDGTWAVHRGAFPQIGFTTKSGLTYSVLFDSPESDGVFDPKLETFVQSRSTLSGSKTSVISEKTTQHTEVRETGSQVVDTGGPGPNDLALHLHQDDASIRYVARIEQKTSTGTALPGTITVSADSARSDANLAHWRNKALLDLWAFLVAHPSRDQLVAAQAALKGLADDAVPPVSAMTTHTEIKNFALTFDGGHVSIGSFAQTLGFDANDTNAGASLSWKLGGLAVSTAALPDWAKAALPRDIEISLATSPLDVTAALRRLVAQADLSTEAILPPDAVAQSLAALAPNGGPTYALKPSVLRNDLMTLSAFGAFSGDGAGKARIEAKGLDDEIAAIAKSGGDDPLAASALQILSVAKAFAAPQPDGRLAWEIVAGAGGLTVNGRKLR